MLIKKLLPILLLTFVNTLGFSLFIPVMPFVVEKYGLGATTYGLLIAVYSAFQFLAAPILGKISNFYGRKNILILSQAGTLISLIIFALAYFIPASLKFFGISVSIIVIGFSRILDGITGGNISVANAYISDITKKSEKTTAFGIVGATFGLGFVFGPAIGSFTSTTKYQYLGSVVTASLISFIALLLLFKLKDTKLQESKINFNLLKTIKSRLNIVKNFLKYKNNKTVFNLLSSKYFFAASFTTYTSVLSLYLKDYLGLGAKGIGLVFTIIGLYLIFNQGFVAPKLSKLFKSKKAILFGQIIIAVCFVILLQVKSVFYFLLVSYFLNIGITLNMINIKTVLVNSAKAKDRAEVLGFDESFASINNSYMPIIAGFIFALFSVNVFLLGAFLMLIALYFLLKIKKI